MKVSLGQFSQLDKSRHDDIPETDVIQIHARRRIYRTQQRKQQLTISTWTRTLYVLSTWESGRRRMIHVYAWEVLALQGAHRFVYSVKYDVNTRGWTRERVKWERWKKSEIASSVATYRGIVGVCVDALWCSLLLAVVSPSIHRVTYVV